MSLKNYFYILILFTLFLSLNLISSSALKKISFVENYQTPPLRILEKLSVGFQFQMASYQWIKFLQSSDYCENRKSENTCEDRSWIFQIIDFATELDPVFEPDMYRSAGLNLSILTGDAEGATLIFEKAVKNHPTYWSILYSAGYHAHFEEKNLLKAAKLYLEASQNGAPQWLSVLAGRLAADEGALEYSQKILQMMIDSNQDEKLINRLRSKIEEQKKKALEEAL